MTVAQPPFKSKGLKRSSPRIVKALCSGCGLGSTDYMHYVKEAHVPECAQWLVGKQYTLPDA